MLWDLLDDLIMKCHRSDRPALTADVVHTGNWCKTTAIVAQRSVCVAVQWTERALYAEIYNAKRFVLTLPYFTHLVFLSLYIYNIPPRYESFGLGVILWMDPDSINLSTLWLNEDGREIIVCRRNYEQKSVYSFCHGFAEHCLSFYCSCLGCICLACIMWVHGHVDAY